MVADSDAIAAIASFLVGSGPVVDRPRRGLLPRRRFGRVQDVDNVVDVQVLVDRDASLHLPGQDLINWRSSFELDGVAIGRLGDAV